MSDKVESHVFVAKSILKRFVTKEPNKNDAIYLLNCTNNYIEKDSHITFNTQYGDYTEEVEDILSKNAERSIGIVVKNINKGVSENLINAIYKYFAYQLLRLNDVHKTIIDKGMTDFTIEELKNLFISKEPDDEVVSKIVHKYSLYILQTNGSKTFMLPEKGLIIWGNVDNDDHEIFVTVSPNILLVFNLPIKGQNRLTYKIVDEDFVKNINRIIYNEARRINNYRVIGIKQELELLIDENNG